MLHSQFNRITGTPGERFLNRFWCKLITFLLIPMSVTRCWRFKHRYVCLFYQLNTSHATAAKWVHAAARRVRNERSNYLSSRVICIGRPMFVFHKHCTYLPQYPCRIFQILIDLQNRSPKPAVAVYFSKQFIG